MERQIMWDGQAHPYLLSNYPCRSFRLSGFGVPIPHRFYSFMDMGALNNDPNIKLDLNDQLETACPNEPSDFMEGKSDEPVLEEVIQTPLEAVKEEAAAMLHKGGEPRGEPLKVILPSSGTSEAKISVTLPTSEGEQQSQQHQDSQLRSLSSLEIVKDSTVTFGVEAPPRKRQRRQKVIFRLAD